MPNPSLHHSVMQYVSKESTSCLKTYILGVFIHTDMRQHTIYPDRDIKFTGHVTWVGKTSIEAKMYMSQVGFPAHT